MKIKIMSLGLRSRSWSQRKEHEEEEKEEESLRDALESLEAHLVSLQTLQQQHWYEREAALVEIDYYCKKLQMKLKEYKGKDLEVIHEAVAFVSESVEENNDLQGVNYG